MNCFELIFTSIQFSKFVELLIGLGFDGLFLTTLNFRFSALLYLPILDSLLLTASQLSALSNTCAIAVEAGPPRH